MLLAALPAAAGVVSSVGNAASSVVSFINPGHVRDEHREARAKWLTDRAIEGSVLAAQIIYAAQDNVAGNEDGYYQTAVARVQATVPAVWAAAVQAGKYWPVGQPFDMPNERARIAQELASQGVSVTSSIPHSDGTPSTPTIETIAHQVGATAAQQTAQNNGYQLVPTNGMWLLAAAAAVVLFLSMRKANA